MERGLGSWLTSPGQHGDSPRFIPLMESIRIPRRALGRPHRKPAAAMADKVLLVQNEPRLPAQTWHQSGHPSQGRPKATPA